MKRLAVICTLLAAFPANAAHFTNLAPGAYRIWMDDAPDQVMSATDGDLDVALLPGQKVALEAVENDPYPTATLDPTEEATPEPTEEPTPSPTREPPAIEMFSCL